MLRSHQRKRLLPSGSFCVEIFFRLEYRFLRLRDLALHHEGRELPEAIALPIVLVIRLLIRLHLLLLRLQWIIILLLPLISVTCKGLEVRVDDLHVDLALRARVQLGDGLEAVGGKEVLVGLERLHRLLGEGCDGDQCDRSGVGRRKVALAGVVLLFVLICVHGVANRLAVATVANRAARLAATLTLTNHSR